MVAVNPSGQIRRLVVFVEHFPPFLGSDRSVFELARRVAENGIRVTFIAVQPLRYLLGRRPDDWPYKKNWERPPPKVHPNIDAHYLLVDRYLQRLWRWLRPFAFLLTTMLFTAYSLKIIADSRSQIVVSAHASPLLGIVSFLAAKLTLRPLIMMCPDWMSAYAATLAKTSMSSLGPVLLQFTEYFLYRLSNRVLVVTDYLKRLLVKMGVPERKVAVIPNGVDTKVFTPSVDASEVIDKYRLRGRVVILFAGHLEDWAGVPTLYNLAVRLDRDYPEAVILLVGTGESSNVLINRLIGSNLGHTLVHAGLQPFDKMPAFNAAADITLCMFPNSALSHAASPLKLFEYMAAGTAVVTTRVAGTMEVVDDSVCVLVRPDNEQDFCDAVVSLCKDPDRRSKLGSRARTLVEKKYSWDILSRQFLRECERIALPYIPKRPFHFKEADA